MRAAIITDKINRELDIISVMDIEDTETILTEYTIGSISVVIINMVLINAHQ